MTRPKSTTYRFDPSAMAMVWPMTWQLCMTLAMSSMGAPFVVARLVALPTYHGRGLPPALRSEHGSTKVTGPRKVLQYQRLADAFEHLLHGFLSPGLDGGVCGVRHG